MTGMVKSRSLPPWDNSRAEAPKPLPLNFLVGPTGGVMQGNQMYGPGRGDRTYRPYDETWRNQTPQIVALETKSRRTILGRF